MKEGMKMPGFTAEASLYNPRRHYNLGVSRGADGQVVIPQEIYNCYEHCISRQPWSYYWQKHCYRVCDIPPGPTHPML